jgi:hypothetical protein
MTWISSGFFLHPVKGGHRRKTPMTEKEVRRRVSVSIFIIGMYNTFHRNKSKVYP